MLNIFIAYYILDERKWNKIILLRKRYLSFLYAMERYRMDFSFDNDGKNIWKMITLSGCVLASTLTQVEFGNVFGLKDERNGSNG